MEEQKPHPQCPDPHPPIAGEFCPECGLENHPPARALVVDNRFHFLVLEEQIRIELAGAADPLDDKKKKTRIQKRDVRWQRMETKNKHK